MRGYIGTPWILTLKILCLDGQHSTILIVQFILQVPYVFGRGTVHHYYIVYFTFSGVMFRRWRYTRYYIINDTCTVREVVRTGYQRQFWLDIRYQYWWYTSPGSHIWYVLLLFQYKLWCIFLLREAEHLKIENEQRHLLEVNTIDHKDQNSEQTNRDWTHTALHCQSVEPRERD